MAHKGGSPTVKHPPAAAETFHPDPRRNVSRYSLFTVNYSLLFTATPSA